MKGKEDFSLQMGGRTPPQATDLEEAILGGIILEKEALLLVIDVIKPEAFYKDQNGRIFSAIVNLYKRSEPVDLLTVVQELKKTNELDIVGGAFYISSLTNRIGSSANIEYHARIVTEKYLQRELIRISTDIIKSAYSPEIDVFELQESAIKSIVDINNIIGGQKKFDTILTLSDKFIEDLIDKKNGKIKPSIPNGIIEIDNYGGNNNSDLIIIGARPGMGKTAFVIKTIRTCGIDLNKPVGVFSLEMSSNQLLTRIVSAECQIDGEKLRSGSVSNDELLKLNNRLLELKNSKIYIDDTPRIDIEVLCSKAKKMKRLYDIEELVIDYLGLITTKEYRGDKTNSTGYISNRLKALAKELDIPVVVLSQLNREVDKRPVKDRIPALSDLRSTGDVEQDADQIYFLFRPEYYGLSYFMIGNEEINVIGKCLVIVAKNRHGNIGAELVGFKKEYTEFYSLKENSIENVYEI